MSDVDLLDHVQGRWKIGEDFVVVEADQVWFLGDSNVFGTLDVQKIDGSDETYKVIFTPSADARADGIEDDTGILAEEKDEASDKSVMKITWNPVEGQDPDTWRKLSPEEFSQCLSELPQESEERRWTKQGQKGSEIQLARAQEGK